MDIDTFFKKPRRLKAPGSLKIKLDREIVKSVVSVKDYGWFERLSSFFLVNRKAWAVVAVVAIIVMGLVTVMRVAPFGDRTVFTPPPAATSPELSQFLDETLGQALIDDQEPESWLLEGDKPGDFDRFFKAQLNQIYRIDWRE